MCGYIMGLKGCGDGGGGRKSIKKGKLWRKSFCHIMLNEVLKICKNW